MPWWWNPACRQAGVYTMYFVYILKSLKTGEYYKGLAFDIDSRLRDHEAGRVQFTKNKLPLVLIHVEIADTLQEARRLEKFFKSGYGREIVKEID